MYTLANIYIEPLSLPSRDWSKVDMEKMTPLYERFAGSELDGTVIARVLKETRKVSPKKKSKEKALAEGGAHAPTLEGYAYPPPTCLLFTRC